MAVDTIKWVDGAVRIIDQTKLPAKLQYITCRDVKTLWKAIRCLSVRGAPALGVAAAFGVLLGTKTYKGRDVKRFIKHIFHVCDYIGTSRPTAVNLFNVLDRMRGVVVLHSGSSVARIKSELKRAAMNVYEEDRAVCRRMGDYGAKLIKNKSQIMTVCNA